LAFEVTVTAASQEVREGLLKRRLMVLTKPPQPDDLGSEIHGAELICPPPMADGPSSSVELLTMTEASPRPPEIRPLLFVEGACTPPAVLDAEFKG